MSTCIVAYIPVLHEGYRKFLSKNSEAKTCYVLGKSIIDQFPVLKKDIRCLDPYLIASALQSWHDIPLTIVLEQEIIPTVSTYADRIVMPDEDISHEFASRYFQHTPVEYDTIFLRWDKKRSTTPTAVNFDYKISHATLFQNEVLAQISHEAEKSSDWWRRVGAAIVKNGEIIAVAYNQHATPHTPYFDGDPRMYFKAGTFVELTNAEHAEGILVGDAARRGVALEDADLYTTTFPCPMCAMFIGRAGIKRCFFREGYAALDAEKTLKEDGIQIILVE